MAIHNLPHKNDRIEFKFKTSDETIRALFKNLPIPTFVWQKANEDFVLVDYNDAAAVITEGKIAGIMGIKADEFYPDMPDITTELLSCYNQKKTFETEKIYRFRTTGEIKHLFVKYVFVPPDLVMVHAEDITASKEAQKQLIESEKRYRELANLLPQTIYETDAAYNIIYSNQAGFDSFLYTAEDLQKGLNIFELIIPEEREQAIQNVTNMIMGQNSAGNEYTALRKDGTTFSANAYSRPIVSNGKVIGLRGILIDISKLKAAQMALRQANDELEQRVRERTEKLAEANNILKTEIAQHRRTQEILTKNEEKYRSVVEQSIDCIFLVDLNTKYIIEANSAFQKLLGYSVDELQKLQVYDFIAHNRDDINQKIEIAKEKGQVFLSERKYRCKDGKLIDVEVSANLICYDHKNLLCIVSRDITNRLRYEKIQRVIYQISESISRTESLNELFKSIRSILGELIDTNNFYIAFHDEQNNSISFPYFVDEKYNRSDGPIDKTLTWKVIKQKKSILVNPDHPNRMTQLNKLEYHGIQAKSWLGVPLKSENRTFGVVVVQSYTNPHQYTNNELELLELVCNQIAIAISHKKAEDELKMTHQIYRAAIENAQGVPYKLNYSKNSYDIMGNRADELLGIDANEITFDKLRKLQRKIIVNDKHFSSDPMQYRKAFRKGEISKYRTDFMIATPTGQTKWISDCAIPIRDNNSGKVIGSLGILQDITERKRVEEALQASEKRYRHVVEDQTEMIYRQLPDGTVSFVNEACCRFLNKKREEIIGKINLPSVPEKEQKVIMKQRSGLNSKNSVVSYEHQMIRHDRKIRWFHRTDRAIFNEHGIIQEYQSVARDITDRKQAEKELEKYRIHLEYLVKKRTQALSVSNQKLHKELIERKRAEHDLLLSKQRYELLYEENPSMYFTIDLKGKVLSVNKFGAEQLGYSVEELIGKSVYAVIHKQDKKIVQQQLKGMNSSIKKIDSWEFRKVRKDGKIIWVKESVRRISDYDGKSFILIVCEDTTDRIQTQLEKEKLLKELAEREKLATLGQFTSAITHEINNPLDIIMTEVDTFVDDYYDLPELLISTEKIKEQVLKINRLAGDILSYAKPQHPEFRLVDVNKILVQTIDLLRVYHQNGIKIETKLSLEIPLITADNIGLEIVFKNIILNAIQSIQKEGKILISTQLIKNDQLRITIKDNGIGIEKSRLKEIFEHFRTSKQDTGGIGLGLAISLEIVKKHHGTIKVKSQLGFGTAFHVYLPVCS